MGAGGRNSAPLSQTRKAEKAEPPINASINSIYFFELISLSQSASPVTGISIPVCAEIRSPPFLASHILIKLDKLPTEGCEWRF